jgi:hypothetical protein
MNFLTPSSSDPGIKTKILFSGFKIPFLCGCIHMLSHTHDICIHPHKKGILKPENSILVYAKGVNG